MSFSIQELLIKQGAGFFTVEKNASLKIVSADKLTANIIKKNNINLCSFITDKELKEILSDSGKVFFKSLDIKKLKNEDKVTLTIFDKKDDELSCALTISTTDSNYLSRVHIRKEILDYLTGDFYNNLSKVCEKTADYLGANSSFYAQLDFNLCCVTGSFNLPNDLREMMPSSKSLLLTVKNENEWHNIKEPELFFLNNYIEGNEHLFWLKETSYKWLLITPVRRFNDISGAFHFLFEDKPDLSFRDLSFVRNIAVFLGYEEENISKIATLKENEDLYKNAIDMLPAVILEAEIKKFRITYINKNGCQNFSLNKKQIEEGISIYDFLNNWQLEEAREYLGMIERGKTPGVREFHYDHPDKGWQTFLVEASLVYRQGIIYGVRLCMTDISEIIEAEKLLTKAKDLAERSNRSKSEFLANMSHEIKTPMNGVLGVLSLLEGTHMDSEQREYLSMVKSSAEELMVILSDILDYSTLEAGRMEIEENEFTIKKIIAQIKAYFVDSFQEKGLELLVEDLDAIQDKIIIGDNEKIYQILYQYLSNAYKFTDEGSISLKIESNNISTSHLSVTFSVIDHGIGISNDKQAVIFDRFTQADSSVTRTYRGAGLGLAICKKTADLLGAEIGVNSNEGEGACFWLKIDLKYAKEKISLTDSKNTILNKSSSYSRCFNPEEALNRSGSDIELLKELMGIFFIDTPEQLNYINEGIEKLDFSLVEMKSHALKGASAIVGASALSQASFDLECFSRSQKTSTLPVNQELLKGLFENIKTEYIRFSELIKTINFESLF